MTKEERMPVYTVANSLVEKSFWTVDARGERNASNRVRSIACLA